MNIVTRLLLVIYLLMMPLIGYAIECNSIETWQSGKIYNKPDQVQFENFAYQAKWWTRGNNPKTNNEIEKYPVWGELGQCGEVTPPPPPPSDACKDIAAWESSTIYLKLDKVQFENVIYEAQWWTRGDNPKVNNTTEKYPVWEKRGTCGDAPPPPPPPPTEPPVTSCKDIDAWDASTVYLENDKASFEGMVYRAKWWTQGGDNPKLKHESNTQSGSQWALHGSCKNPAPVLAKVGDTDIRPTRNNANSIISIIKDDGYLKTTKLWCGYIKENGLSGKLTEALIVNQVNNNKSWQAWRDLYDSGCLDFANHSIHHSALDSGSLQANGYNLDTEVNGAQAILEKELPEAGKPIIYVVPKGVVDDTIRAKVQEQHASLKGGFKFKGYNTLDPSEAGWYRLKQHQTKPADKSGPETNFKDDLKVWADTAIANDLFLVISTHSCGDGAWGAIPCSEWEKFFKHLASYNSNDYWFEGAGLVTKYIREKQNATVTPSVDSASKITVNLTDTLPNDVFNYPLLLRTRVPSDWGQVGVKQGTGASVTVNTQVEDGVTVLYYEAIPDAGNIVLTRF